MNENFGDFLNKNNNKEEKRDELLQGAEKMEQLNQEAENATSKVDKENALQKAAEMENNLDKLEKELGFDGETAQEVLVEIYEGKVDIVDAIKSLQEEFPDEVQEAFNSEVGKSFWRDLKAKVPSSKILAMAAMYLVVSGAALAIPSLSNAEPLSIPGLENLTVVRAENIYLQENFPEFTKRKSATSLFFHINNNKNLNGREKVMWSTILAKKGHPQKGESVYDYVFKGGKKLTMSEKKFILKEAKAGDVL